MPPTLITIQFSSLHESSYMSINLLKRIFMTKGWLTVFMTDVDNPKLIAARQTNYFLYHKKISVGNKAKINCFTSYTFRVLNSRPRVQAL